MQIWLSYESLDSAKSTFHVVSVTLIQVFMLVVNLREQIYLQ